MKNRIKAQNRAPLSPHCHPIYVSAKYKELVQTTVLLFFNIWQHGADTVACKFDICVTKQFFSALHI